MIAGKREKPFFSLQDMGKRASCSVIICYSLCWCSKRLANVSSLYHNTRARVKG